MSLVKEFKDFAMRGNVVDLAVGVVIGAAFGKVVGSLVEKIVMPITGYLTGGIDFKDRSVTLPVPELAEGMKPPQIGWGAFAQSVIDFVIVTAPYAPWSMQSIIPPAAVFEIAPAKVLQGAVRLQGFASSPTPEIHVRVA